MTKQPIELEKIGPLYANLMEEIKRRVDAVRQVLNGTCPLAPMAAFEFCYLQLRKICEVFALACLTAHGDIPGVRSRILQKTYSADQILKQLSKLHPDFYPVPSNQQHDPVTKKVIAVQALTSGYLTKKELLELYGECGNYLHRGSIRQLLTKWEPTLDFKAISVWLDKLIKLLSHHQIQTSDPEKQIWVLMHDAKDGKVHWSVMQVIPRREMAKMDRSRAPQ